MLSLSHADDDGVAVVVVVVVVGVVYDDVQDVGLVQVEVVREVVEVVDELV